MNLIKMNTRFLTGSLLVLLTTSLTFAHANGKGLHTSNSPRFGKMLYGSDPTYSVHNYKQPNKAELARRFNLDHLQRLQALAPSNQANYKQPTSFLRSQAIRLSWEKHRRASVELAANYKRQAQ